MILSRKVTPRAGVWIEIGTWRPSETTRPSLPVRECGLKFAVFAASIYTPVVTPRAGVWIEITVI